MHFSDTRPGAPADTEHYTLAADGGLDYIPLTREGEKTGAAAAYAGVPCHTGVLKLGGATAVYALPKRMTAYDPVPLRYTLSCPDRTQTLHLSVTAFEEEAHRPETPSFDLNLPGTVDMTFTFLGFVAGQVKEEVHPVLGADFADRQGTEFPGFALEPERCSGCLPEADRLWLHFTCQNTGNTILDGEGNGSFMIEPVLLRRDEAGEYVPFAVPSNLFYRLFAPLYPGEQTELYVTCGAYAGYPAPPGALPPGEYRLRLAGIRRSEQKQPDFARVVWSGTPATVSFFDFTIAKEPYACEPAPVVKQPPLPPDRNGWLHRYEEFLSSFVTSAKRPKDEESGTLAVQPAPWTKLVVLRLMQGDEEAVAEVCLPVEVESDSLTLTLSPAHPGTVRQKDGTVRPAVVTQSMADMRGGAALTPLAAESILGDLADMRRAGINLIATTVAFAMETGTPPRIKRGGARDAFKFMADVLRVMELPMEGLISYPFSSPATQQLAGAVRRTPMRATKGIADPVLTEACGETARYEFWRYGDNYWQLGDGRVPLCVEDTRGWIRYDQHNRYPEGEASAERFRDWLRERYGSVEAVNAAWGSQFASFAEIDPEKDGAPGAFGHKNEYRNADACFHDYSPAILDWDRFRTSLRREQYRAVLDYVTPLLPQAAISLRTEGANWLVAGIPWDSENPKYRHIRFSQLHNGMWAEELLKDGTIAVHSDYTTLPYTPTEVAELTRMSVAQGVIPMHMPQFNRMRDIALNPRWGSDDYTVSYHLATPMKGAYVNTLTALFPWFRATAENGGIPGILWQDYLCDGYVTQTQYRELCFFRDKLEAWLATEEGKRFSQTPSPASDDFRARSRGLWSYAPAYIRETVARAEQTPRQNPFDLNEKAE